MRILVTGSRDWLDEKFICQILNHYRDKNPKRGDGGGHVLVSGECPTGADRIAEAYADDVGWHVERHPAVWIVDGKFDRRAGYIRNAEMVELGADVCLAFIRDDSPGASHTAKLAIKAGIETRIWRI